MTKRTCRSRRTHNARLWWPSNHRTGAATAWNVTTRIAVTSVQSHTSDGSPSPLTTRRQQRLNTRRRIENIPHTPAPPSCHHDQTPSAPRRSTSAPSSPHEIASSPSHTTIVPHADRRHDIPSPQLNSDDSPLKSRSWTRRRHRDLRLHPDAPRRRPGAYVH
jgi:hypothetical protein